MRAPRGEMLKTKISINTFTGIINIVVCTNLIEK